MTQSQPTSTGHSSSDSDTIGLSTDQTPTSNAENISNESESNQLSNRERIEKIFSFNPSEHLMNIRNHHNLDWDLYRELSNLISDTNCISFNKGMLICREMQCDTEHFKSYYNDEHLSKFALPKHNHRWACAGHQSPKQYGPLQETRCRIP